MEQLVIFILFIVVSIISSVIQQRNKKKEEEAMQRDFPPVNRGPDGSEPPRDRPVITRWPASMGELQERVKRMLQENAPPIIRPVIVPEKPQTHPGPAALPKTTYAAPERLEDASDFHSHAPGFVSPHDRVSNMQARVAARLRAASDQTTSHRPVIIRSHRPIPNDFIRRLRADPTAARDAFVASLIFSPPKSLDTTDPL